MDYAGHKVIRIGGDMGNNDEKRTGGLGLIIDEDDDTLLPNRRAAVIIGVGTSAGLPNLSSAGPTARRIGAWLTATSPGYDVTVITDEDGHEVTRSEIFKAIREYVTVPVRYEILLVHYIGHGLYQMRNDIWMLSDLPTDRAACVSLTATLNDAKFCGIPNVVVVSDACRNLPGEAGLSDVDPSSIIPQHDEFPEETSCVDYFQATGRGTPAFEGEIDGERQSFLSHAFREAYRNPLPEMVLKLADPEGAPMFVVPNRKLGHFLKTMVAKKLGETDAAKSQKVFPVTPSDDSIFIAPVDRLPAADPDRMTTYKRPRSVQPSSGRRALGFGYPSGSRRPKPDTPSLAMKKSSRRPETEVESLLLKAKRSDWSPGNDPRLRGAPPSGSASQTVTDFETQTGLTLTGAGIARAAMTAWPTPGSYAEPAPEKAADDLSVLRLHPAAGPVGELAVALDDGRCMLLPVLQGYICHVAVDVTGAHTTAYVPGWSNWRSEFLRDRAPEIDRLRALATEAMDQNRFHVGSKAEAKRLADVIRMEKAGDPILGLLAAQAYAEAGMSDRVRDVSMYMNTDIQADLFDVRLLSTRFWQEHSEYPVVPRCPMLTQNWALLDPRRAVLPPVLVRLRSFLTDSLWTTFSAGAAEILFEAIETGEL
jgi:hypothetical protein